ncbi:MAG: MATE family efflux transporter [Eubacteriales bacterium]|nr:MATE family efflux transporter [Eubacteriales bacterium]
MKMQEKTSRNEQMLHAPVEKLIARLAVPTMISMLITAVYNMADTYFVSQIGTSASGAVGIIFSAMALIQAFSFTFGIGTGNHVSRLLGAGKAETANQYVAVGWFTGFIFGTLLGLCGLLNLHSVVKLLGATDTIAPYAMDYARFIFMATPFMMCSFIMNNILRFQGLAAYAMVGITIGGVLNMLLDPLFIFGLGMGTAGAGLATGLSQFVSFLILFGMCNLKKDTISVKFGNFKPSRKIYGDILYTGSPSLARQGVTSFATVVLNRSAGVYGDAAIAALSIVSRYTMFMNSLIVGFGQGFQPVCGFNMGAKKYQRVKKAFYFCVKVSTAALLVLCVVSMLLSGNIIALFRKDDADVIAMGTYALRVQLLTMPLWGFYVMSNMFSQTAGYGLRASVISAARQGICFIPLVLILPRLFGLKGLLITQPVADVFAFALSIVLVTGILKQLNQKSREENSVGGRL